MNYAVDDPRLFTWLQNIGQMGAGHFLSAIASAAFRADGENARILYSVLKQLQEKYPKYNPPALAAEPDATFDSRGKSYADTPDPDATTPERKFAQAVLDHLGSDEQESSDPDVWRPAVRNSLRRQARELLGGDAS